MTHPKMEAARASICEEEGGEISATAAFEPKLKADNLSLPSGFYNYHRLATWVEQTLPSGGVKVEVGYRRSDGTVPPYYGELETRTGGEVFAKIAVPTLANAAIDKPRAEVLKARLSIDLSSQELNLTWLELARDTTLAYWDWVAAGQLLKLRKSLLDIAEERAEGLGQKVDEGALPPIIEVENQGSILTRQTALIKAEKAFVKAQAKLSLFYRDTECEPVVANLEEVPEAIAVLPIDDELDVDKWAEEALRNRPEVVALEIEKEKAQIDLDLAYNEGLPQFDINSYVARDLGSGKASLGQTDVGIGFSLSVPLYRRKFYGERERALAKMTKIEAKQRYLYDEIEATIRQLVEKVKLSKQQLEFASTRLDITEKLVEAEKVRFREGSSDLLTINIRELSIAKAAEDAINAELDLHSSLAELLFARGFSFDVDCQQEHGQVDQEPVDIAENDMF